MENLQKTSFKIDKMDCPSEENLIRLKLGDVVGIHQLEFDIPNRKLAIFHDGESLLIEQAIAELKLGERKISTETVDLSSMEKQISQRKLLWAVLIINFAFFLIEVIAGLLANSMGLLADSLDMLADALVYGMSLFAVGGSLLRKKRIATMAGYFQISLAVIGFMEVVRRFMLDESMPDFSSMIVVSLLALVANGICLYLLQKSKSKEAHMQASMIFTSNDVIINLGVIVAGFLVHVLHSNMPDLIVGTIVFVLVIQGAIRILKLGK